MKAFGIGCLHFSFKGGAKKELTVQEYVDEVRGALERLPNISNVELFFDLDVKGEVIDTSISTHMNDGDPCYPHISMFNLSFDIYLPLRVQAEVIGSDQKYVHTNTENFRVTFKHDWYGALSVVELIGGNKESSPSTAVQIVREYLKREVDSGTSILKLDFVGPSPFHADFFLIGSNEQFSGDDSSRFQLAHLKTPGYDELKFLYSCNQYKSEEVAFKRLLTEISSEVAFFYELKILHSRRAVEWSKVQESLHGLLEMEGEGYRKTLRDRFVKKPRLLNSLYRDIGLFKGQEIFDKNIRDRHYFSIYKAGKHSVYLRDFVDAVLANWTVYPVKETSEIVDYFQGKSSKHVELAVVLFAAILGGSIGAAITVLFGS